MENQKGRKVKFLRSDNGGEYTSSKFKEYLVSEGIEYQLTILGRPGQNRVVECMNQTITKCAHGIRLQTDMSEDFWAEAVSLTSYLVNISLSIAVNLQISEEIWQRESVEYSIL